MDNALTDKQERFCREYIIDCNATQAAIRAGYSEDTARQAGARMLTNDNIVARLGELKSDLNKRLEDRYNVDKERVIREFAKIAFADIRCLFNEDGTLKPIHELDDDAAAVLQQIDVDELFQGSDAGRILVGQTKKVRVYDKLTALNSLTKVLGYNAPVKKDVKVGLNLIDFMKKATADPAETYEPDDDNDE